MQEFLKNQAIGFVFGILTTLFYDYKLKGWIAQFKERKEERKVHSINVLDEYRTIGNPIPVVSYGDSKAIVIEPLMQYGKAILIARLDISNKPQINQDRNFVMALLKYTSNMDWHYYADLGYDFKFKVRGNIEGLQLEIKDAAGQKIIDEYIQIQDSFKEYKISLKNKKGCVDKINEICFTAFCEDGYIAENTGRFEIYDCMLANSE